MSEWSEFRVGAIRGIQSCTPFSKVWHVSHTKSAVDVVRDGRIRARLVYDASILNQYRTTVVWCSPNDWYQGFIYGNIAFEYDWQALIDGKSYYWVEAIENYNPTAVRILVTDRQHSELAPYDPTTGDGPWWHDNATGIHYRNGIYTREVMVETDLLLAGAIRTSFVDHHPAICNIDGSSCPDLGTDLGSAGSEFIARLIADRRDTEVLRLLEEGNPSFYLLGAFGTLRRNLIEVKCEYAGDATSTSPQSGALVRALLAAYARRDAGDIGDVAAIFKSQTSMLRAVAKIVAATFEVSAVASLYEGEPPD